MCSWLPAFAFHRTAFKERLEELDLGLRVIEQLRNYKPKYKHQKSSSHTHMFSARGFMTPFGEKEGFNFLGSRQHTENAAHSTDDGCDADMEDKSRKGKGKHRPKESKALSKTDSPVDILADKGSSTPGALGSDTNTSPEEPGTLHQYPPTSSRWASSSDHHDDYNPALQAARVLKSAVLHDARNIQGNNYDLTEVVTSVTTTYEAKVRFFPL